LQADAVTFNWNTEGAGYAVSAGGVQLLAVNRTGALPVSYFPDGIPADRSNPIGPYEQKAYEYFARTSDPNLARVVQYATLYQIFRRFGIHAEIGLRPAVAHPEGKVLAALASRIVGTLADADDDTLAAILNYPKMPVEMRRNLATELVGLRRELVRLRAGQTLTAVGDVIANPRSDERFVRTVRGKDVSQLTQAERWQIAAREVAAALQDRRLRAVLQHRFANPAETMAMYIKAARERPTEGWIRTPSIVLSRTLDELADWEGGHNLDARVAEFRLSNRVEAGHVEVIKDSRGKVVLYNESDLPKLQGLLRTAAIHGDDPRLPQILSTELSHVQPKLLPRAKVLEFPSTAVKGPTDRGFQVAEADTLPVEIGWAPDRLSAAKRNVAAKLSSENSRALVIEKTSDAMFRVTLPKQAAPEVARTYEAAMDLVVGAMKNGDGPAGSWQIYLPGFDLQEANLFRKTAEVQFAGREDLRLTAISGGREITSEPMLRALRTYDFEHARITESVIEAGGETPSVLVSMEVPARAVGRQSILVRIRLFFRNLVPENVHQAVNAAVAKVLGRDVRPADNAAALLAEIRSELKTIHGAEDVQIDVQLAGFGDLLMIELRSPNKETSDVAA
jgi:hypothetical protein